MGISRKYPYSTMGDIIALTPHTPSLYKVYQVYLQGYCASKMYHNDYSSLVWPWQRVIGDLCKSHHIFTFCTTAALKASKGYM